MLLVFLVTIILTIAVCCLLWSVCSGADIIWLFVTEAIIMVIVATLYFVLKIVSKWKLFTKMGEKGWKSIIPIYGSYILYKCTWKPRWYLITILCSVLTSACNYFGSDTSLILNVIIIAMLLLSFIISVMSKYKLSVAFGHGIGYTFGLYFLNLIFQMILAFGDSEYQGIVEDDSEYQEIVDDDFDS